MRKRAQMRSKPTTYEPKHVTVKEKITTEEKKFKFFPKKNWWIAVSLLGIFLLILFLNTYFNFTSEIAINSEGEGLNKFYLSGPDPYYNRRLVETTYETGKYPYYSEDDPLLNYPLGRSGARAPLFNMMAVGFSTILSPFMDEIDALGYSMQFIPALFGALLIFPVYFIGKELFNKKAGLIGAVFVALIPIHLGSGHGSAYSLFDHDSFNLLLFFFTFLFLIKSIREKDPTKSLMYAILGGVPLAALSMTWVKSQYLYMIIAIYAFVQMFINIFRNKIDFGIFRTSSVMLFTGYLISLPVITAGYGKFRPDVNLYMCLAVTIFGIVYYFFRWKKIPWTIGLPVVIGAFIAGLIFLYPPVLKAVTSSANFLAPLNTISDTIYGLGIYGSKVSMTIAEANTYEISHSVMSFGPALYWLGWTGFLFMFYYFIKDQDRKDFLFVIVLFLVSIWLTSIAGRFINDMVPTIALLAGWTIWMLIQKVDYKQMIRNIKSAGGGFHGIRRGVNFLHIFGICFIAFLVLLPNAFIAFDAAIPSGAITNDGESELKIDLFGEDHSGAFGLGIGKERYWGKAFEWLSRQDLDISNPADRPAFISWWDYGFYEAAMGAHPTVADNFQDGIPPASNFHTASSEKEAVVIFIVRLLEGDLKKNNGKLSDDVKLVLNDRLGTQNASKIINWMEDPTTSPSYGDLIEPQYHEYLGEDLNKQYLTVGSQWPEIAAYHDIVYLLANDTYGISEEDITMLYHYIQDATGWSIRYYGVEGYDKQIFNIFAFLSDKSLLMLGAPKDQFVEVIYTGKQYPTTARNRDEGVDASWTAQEIYEMSDYDKRFIEITDRTQQFLDPYYDTMFYRTYFGFEESDNVQIPCLDMKHFYAEYKSDLSQPYSAYYTGISAVVIAKYYEGAVVTGKLVFNNSGTIEPMDSNVAVVKELAYTGGVSYNISHDKVDTIQGNFSVIVGAGGVIQILRYPEIDSGIPWYGAKSFLVKEIDLNISDDTAMRKNDDWEIDLGNVTIEPANLSGYIFDNLDGSESYNQSKDDPLQNATIILQGINKLEITQDNSGNTQFKSTEDDYTMIRSAKTDENGSYNFEGLKPGYYIIEVSIDDIPIERSLIPLYSGENDANISKPKDASVEGYVYYDENLNNKQDSSDTKITQAKVKLLLGDKLVKETTTDNSGFYSFKSITPGNIRGTDINIYTVKVTQLPYYQSEVTVSPEENITTSLNISIGLAPVNVSGYTKYNNNAIGDVTVEFNLDETESNNTAVADEIVSNETTGYYEIALTPGYYNVSISKKDGDTLVYSYTEKLDIARGQPPKQFDISLSKISKTINGITKDSNGNIIGGVTVKYIKDEDYENNTAVSNSITSDDTTGAYSVELSKGYYIVNATKMDDNGIMTVYHSESKDEIDDADEGKNVVINVDKKTVTMSGTTKYNGKPAANVTIYFSKNETKENNKAEFTLMQSSETGSYTVEIKPGTYDLKVGEEDIFIENGVNKTYTISEESSRIVINENDITGGYKLDLILNSKET